MPKTFIFLKMSLKWSFGNSGLEISQLNFPTILDNARLLLLNSHCPCDPILLQTLHKYN